MTKTDPDANPSDPGSPEPPSAEEDHERVLRLFVFELVDFGDKFGISKPAQIIEEFADTIADYLKISEEVRLMDGLRESIEKSLSTAKVGVYTSTGYTHRKKRKFE